MRLDPALEESRRDRQPRHGVFDAVQFHAFEPALEDVLTDFGAQPLLDSLPALLLRGGHCSFSFVSDVEVNSVKRKMAPRDAGAATRTIADALRMPLMDELIPDRAGSVR